ncbi:MFS general substrate transporter [Mollisia scopiformis]|uniref:MFS general substrate transporter n=1 Tax=Mollisia scopiformis TaxID=149040 RepID=A0A194WV46_MOLSC|nr:MFS general substrate transporter [Mollisia scopiformis]KUJ11457.1 MFS general substrate transporter [Mollisia scopiformis]
MDEERPLLHHVDQGHCPMTDQPVVDFDPKGDIDNPLEWSKAYKLGVISLLSFMAFTTTFTCIGVVPVAERIVFDLQGKESKSASILLVTVWELGEAAGPLLIAPLSEIYGRYPVFNAANMIFILGVLLAALSQTANTFILARFLTGLAVAANVLNPAIIGDIYPSELRGSAMSLVMLSPLIGGAIGPAIGGSIAESIGWRKILWMSAILAIVCEVLFLVLLRETYKVSILKRRAARLREETMDESLKCAWEEENGGMALWWSELRTSIARPMIVLWDSFVLKIMAFYGGLVFTLYYVLATTLPGILKDIYGFSPALIGYSFLAFSVGASFGIVACNLYLDDIYIKLGKSHGGARPEFRLPFMIGGATFMPVVVALYGWAPYAHWPVYVILLAVALLGFALLFLSVPLTSYIVDAFGLYSASAMTMILIARCLGGTLLPLAIPPLTDALGLGYGFVLVAGIFLALIPVPMLVMRYGSVWRQKSVYTRNE